jgi:hypothetical protein
LFISSLLPFAGKLLEKEERVTATNEQFDPELIRLNSLDKVLAYADSLYATQSDQKLDTELYARTLSTLIRNRFFQGTLNYSASDNWIANLGGKILWSHLSSIVLPNDILKHPQGLCSQQTIVFMNCLRKKNINVRSIGLGYEEGPGHFVCEVAYNKSWHLHDVSFEPVWANIKEHHMNIEYYLLNRDSLFKVYDGRLTRATLDKILERVKYGNTNELPAGKMRLLHSFTFLVTILLPFLFLFLSYRAYRKKDKVVPHKNGQAKISKIKLTV